MIPRIVSHRLVFDSIVSVLRAPKWVSSHGGKIPGPTERNRDSLRTGREAPVISEPLGPELNQRLEQVPCYDPEGWSLIFNTGSLKAKDSK
jgi:hypothetical protein